MQGHLPATLPHHQFAVIGSAVGMKGKGAGHGGKAKRQKANRSPQALLREAFIVGGPCDTRGSSGKHTSSRVGTMELVIQGFVGYSENSDRCWSWWECELVQENSMDGSQKIKTRATI